MQQLNYDTVEILGISKSIPIIERLDLDEIPEGTQHRLFLKLVDDSLGLPIMIPIMVARGVEPGPVLAVTAAVHGNELNGIPVIHRLFHDIDPKLLKGTIMSIPVVNVPGFLLMQRKFNDDFDLNHLMPGKPNGNNSEVYAYRFLERAMGKIDYLLDLHTASFGRINSYYVRANYSDPTSKKLAELQNAQIIVNSPAPDGTLRWSMQEQGTKAITLEVGDPNRFQKGLIRSGLEGVHNTIIHLGMMEGEIELPEVEPVLCSDSFWMYTDAGGILQVYPQVAQRVKKGEEIASLKNIFGDLIRKYQAPSDGIVIGKSVHPTAQTGSRILHLGVE
ncbi:MAG: succinylglutamate desuccinylase/aspartoacylase family protein [Saprospiraceae bacterium]|nr:succinylglutamate desuccinylase/aspartoacylase family protein [Saprospiraceae bacterium]